METSGGITPPARAEAGHRRTVTVERPRTGPRPDGPPARPPRHPGPALDLDTTDAALPSPPRPEPATPSTGRRHLRTLAPGKAALVLAALAALVWLIVNSRALMTMSMGLVFAVLVDGFLARRALARIRIDLAPAGDTVADEPSRWSLHPHRVLRPIQVRPALRPRPAPVLVDRDHPGTITLPPAPRGLLHLSVLDVTAVGPIGLCRAGRRVVAVPATPRVVRPRPVPLTVRWPLPQGIAVENTRPTPHGDDQFRGVRPYRRGDERRKIHWKSTAHTGELMVREEEGTGVVSVQIVVELGPPGPGTDDAVGHADRVAEAAIQEGWAVQLVTLDATPGPPRVGRLGRPLGRRTPEIEAGTTTPATVAQAVTGSDAVRRQLATATAGMPSAPPWASLRCHVTEAGVRWT
jgi:hypothetical protein